MRYTSTLQWETLLDDTEWDSEKSLVDLLTGEQRSEPEQPRPRSPLRRALAAVALSTFLACFALLWLAAQHGVAAIEAELHELVDVETWLQRSETITATASLVDAEADPAWRSAYLREMELASESGTSAPLEQALVERTHLRSGLAMVQVTVTGEDGEAYRETRFYCEGPAGWQRTSPQDAFWGREQTMESDYFRIRYRQADAQAVMAAAPKLDRIYEQLRADLSLSGDAPHLTVDVAPTTLDAMRYLEFEYDHLTVPSPVLLQASADVSDDAMLVQSIVYPLVGRVWDEAAASADVRQDGARLWWGPMSRGLQLWLGAANDEQTADWLSGAARWLYSESPDVLAGLREPMVADRRTLCRGESLWRFNVPVYDSLGSLCLAPDLQLRLRYMARAPGTLHQLLAFDELYPHPLSASVYEGWQYSVAAATIVDYFVRTYGHEQLPELVAAFRTHDSWDTLIPAVTGVSAAEFEAGWQAFLAEEYGYQGGEK